jgi:preprotein translocase subunit SecG
MSELLLLAIVLGATALLVTLGLLDVSSWTDRSSWFSGGGQPSKAKGLRKVMGGMMAFVGFLLFITIVAVVFSTP